MATTTPVLPTADCEVLDAPKPEVKAPAKLQMFMEPLTALEMIQRTERYAKDPKQYLKDTRGEAEVEAQKEFLCLPDEITMDSYGTGTTRQHFEAHIAKLLGKKFGRFFITGVQAQLAALKTHSERSGRKKMAWHVSSHLQTAEADSYCKLYGLDRVFLGSRAVTLPTVEEIRTVLDVPEQDRPAAILIEIPNRVLGCQTYSYSELQYISRFCRIAGVKLHCDGARLWEIEPHYAANDGVSFKEICACFDSVYVSFYKGLGGLAGAMLVHDDEEWMTEAKVWQRRAGGLVFTLGVEVLDCQRGFNQMIGTFARKREKMMRIIDSITAAVDRFKTGEGEPVVEFLPRKATCAQIVTLFRGYSDEEFLKARDKVEAATGVRVIERLRPMDDLEAVMAGTAGGDKEAEQERKTNKVHCTEWMIMGVTEKIDDQVFVDAYEGLCKELTGLK